MEDCEDKDLPVRRQAWVLWRDACEYLAGEIKRLEDELIVPDPQ